MYNHYIKDSKAKICRGAVGRGWGGNVCCGFVVNHSVGGEVGRGWGGNVCCGFVVNHTYQWWWGMGSNCSCRFVYMQRVSTCYTTEITNHCYTAKITLCSLVEDCCTPVSQHHALAWVGY